MKTTVVWFYNDLRLSDNPALFEACQRGAVIPLFIYAPEELGDRAPGGASRWWLHHSLSALNKSLQGLGARLFILRASSSLKALESVLAQTGADAVFWNCRYDPVRRRLDEVIERTLKERGFVVRTFPSYLLHDPETFRGESGRPYLVFTRFWKRLRREILVPEPLPSPRVVPLPPTAAKLAHLTVPLESLNLISRTAWDTGIQATWTPGEAGARRRLEWFLSNALEQYPERRDRPDLDATSRLSPHLHYGEITPRQIWHAVLRHSQGRWTRSAEHFLRELGWREFAYHILYHYPQTLTEPLRREFRSFPWSEEPSSEHLSAWQRGQTGIPIVDAGMRQLWHTGWMHNRVRMIVASWLTKNLLIHWRLGESWFWDTLVDADPANNVFGWQWTAGCGADAAPYYRIFNPVLQGRKFDPIGAYVRQWVPELANLPTDYIHAPWEAPPDVLRRAGVELGKTYPLPQVESEESRQRALEVFKQWRESMQERSTVDRSSSLDQCENG